MSLAENIEPVQINAALTATAIARKYRLFGSYDAPYIEQVEDLTQGLRLRREHIDAALSSAGPVPTHTFDDIFQMCLTQRLTFWPLANNTVAVTEIVKYPRSSTYHTFLAGGPKGALDTIYEWIPDMLLMAEASGCSQVSCAGRPGWAKALKSRGWRPYVLIVSRGLDL